jgi:hypothetical protein
MHLVWANFLDGLLSHGGSGVKSPPGRLSRPSRGQHPDVEDVATRGWRGDIRDRTSIVARPTIPTQTRRRF